MKLETGQSNSDPAPVAVVASQPTPPPDDLASAWSRFRGMILFTAILLIAFGMPLLKLAGFAFHAELYSHILLIPFVSAYLVWIKRRQLVYALEPSRALALVSFAGGVIVLAGYWVAVRKGWPSATPDYLAAMTLSFLLFLLGGGFIFLGSKFLKPIAFPVAFLFFSIPFPLFMREGIEWFFQQGSTEVAYLMLRAAGMPVFRTGTHFQLPAFSLDVAPACSGIHSSLVLVITSCVAAYLFLETSSKRWVFALVVIPLALLRNGFRIFTIAELCVHIGPQMIDSPIHRQGGPLFFLLSLVPLFLLLVYLSKRELRKKQATGVRPEK